MKTYKNRVFVSTRKAGAAMEAAKELKSSKESEPVKLDINLNYEWTAIVCLLSIREGSAPEVFEKYSAMAKERIADNMNTVKTIQRKLDVIYERDSAEAEEPKGRMKILAQNRRRPMKFVRPDAEAEEERPFCRQKLSILHSDKLGPFYYISQMRQQQLSKSFVD